MTVRGHQVVIEIFRAQPRGFRGSWSCLDLPCFGASGVVDTDIDNVIAVNEGNAFADLGNYLESDEREQPSA